MLLTVPHPYYQFFLMSASFKCHHPSAGVTGGIGTIIELKITGQAKSCQVVFCDSSSAKPFAILLEYFTYRRRRTSQLGIDVCSVEQSDEQNISSMRYDIMLC